MDLMLSRYGGGYESFGNMVIEDGFGLIKKAIEQRDKEQAYQIWLIQYESMEEKNFISFEDWYSKLKADKEDTKQEGNFSKMNKEEILSMAEKIKQFDQK